MSSPNLPRPLPAVIRCNRGFGWTFWVVTLTAPCVSWLMSLGGQSLGLVVASLVLAGIMVALRLLVLPRLEFHLAQGVLRNRRRTIPASSISRVEFKSHGRSGTWADIFDTDGNVFTRMAVANTLCAAPDATQWAGLHRTLHAAAQVPKGPAARPVPTSGKAVGIADALRCLNDQVAWLRAGNRSNASGAPAKFLLLKTVVLP